MAKKKTIRTIPQARTPMREQDAAGAGAQLRRGRAAATRSRTRCAKPSAASSAPTQPCVRGCPVGIDIPGFIQKIARQATSAAPTTSSPTPTCCRRSAAASARRRTSARACARSARRSSRWRSAASSASSATRRSARAGPTCPTSSRTASGSASSAPGPPGMACAADMAKAGCEVTVYEAFHAAGRRAASTASPTSACPTRSSTPRSTSCSKLGVRFECNTLVGRLFTIEQMIDEMGFHAVFIGTGAGYPELHGHSRRVAQRRALGQRAAHALQPDARARLPELRHAAAARQARRGGRRRQHRDGRDARVAAPRRREGLLRLSPHRAPRRRRAPRRSTTPRRKASSSTG